MRETEWMMKANPADSASMIRTGANWSSVLMLRILAHLPPAVNRGNNTQLPGHYSYIQENNGNTAAPRLSQTSERFRRSTPMA